MKHLTVALRPGLVTLSVWTLVAMGPTTTAAQTPVTTPAQKATAQQVAQSGVPLSELAPDAPDHYRVKKGDTLWAISGVFLKRPWRWPELWGMNMAEIRNPHLIYPGQELHLVKKDGRAMLTTAKPVGSEGIQTVRVSPTSRVEPLLDSALPTLETRRIEAFLAEPIVVDEAGLAQAARIVATRELRVLLSRGDRAYARGPADKPLSLASGQPRDFRVFRNAVPLKDPESGAILGYEAQYIGNARLVAPEKAATPRTETKAAEEAVPASLEIVQSTEEMRVGDRLLPEPPREFPSYVPRAPETPVDGRVVSVYGSGVRFASQNQVVAINRGTRDGLEVGHVLQILTAGERVTDRTDPTRPTLRVPDERNGLMMVFRTFDRVSYALILEITDVVRVGDRLVNPR
ncbi:MAG: LysM peptidoglycan-binding domain-containing protein [Burkholderiaceae bacterium]|jgi:nucleoid-associated protein YgaU|nr:LysM peptidoglycan-binding domain-containing protein [Burkholderiaceae bacterium]